MNSSEIRQAFLNFFQKKKHKIIPSSSLLPPDTTVLFTTAGMQQFSLYLEGKKNPTKDFGTCHLVSCQKCFRTDDIDEIGDDTHHTFFEMLGNWSIGQDESGYFKQGAIKYALEFLVDGLKLDKNRFWVTIFKGNQGILKDKESEKIWREQGIPKERIKEFGEEDNFWGPVGITGPCGPCSEIYYDRGKKFGCKEENCGPNCPNCQRFIEIWNLVFMEYLKNEKGEFELLSQKNIDTGIGFERLAAILQNKPSAYETDLFLPIIQKIEKLSNKKYETEKKSFRIIADHIRGSVFLISEGILPSNIEQGYILRRLLRRVIRYGKVLGTKSEFLTPLAQKVIEIYKDVYPEVLSEQADILTVIQNEEEKFEKTLESGEKRVRRITKTLQYKIKGEDTISGQEAFNLYQSYGFPLELTEEIAKEKGLRVDKEGFLEAQKKHQETSRAGREKKFGGHGIDNLKLRTYNLQVTKLHTATHLLQAALRKVLGKEVRQMGSDINEERLRFDFSFYRKLTAKEIKKVEDLVNQKIQQDLKVKREEMNYNEAIKQGALSFFKEKYPEIVTVYTILETGTGRIFSKEICAGPHIEKTGKLGNFKVVKEESSSAEVRRIKAVLANN